jgi:hypothetical protein
MQCPVELVTVQGYDFQMGINVLGRICAVGCGRFQQVDK